MKFFIVSAFVVLLVLCFKESEAFESYGSNSDESSECQENAEKKSCGSACPEVCGQEPQICTEQCVAGCFCKDGYILDEDREKCIPREECGCHSGSHEEDE